MKKKESLLDKISGVIFEIEGFVAIVCFIIAPLMAVITDKEYVGIIIFLLGLGFYGVHYFSNLTKKD